MRQPPSWHVSVGEPLPRSSSSSALSPQNRQPVSQPNSPASTPTMLSKAALSLLPTSAAAPSCAISRLGPALTRAFAAQGDKARVGRWGVPHYQRQAVVAAAAAAANSVAIEPWAVTIPRLLSRQEDMGESICHAIIVQCTQSMTLPISFLPQEDAGESSYQRMKNVASQSGDPAK